MKTITIGFSKSKKALAIGSWLIRGYMGTPYSHVYMKFESASLNRTLIYEAVGAGVRFMGNNAWENHAIEVDSFYVDVSDDNYKLLMQYCVDMAGGEYGYLQNLGIVIASVLNLKHNPFKSGKNCSELVAEILQLEGYNIPININLVTPKDIHNVLMKHPHP